MRLRVLLPPTRGPLTESDLREALLSERKAVTSGYTVTNDGPAEPARQPEDAPMRPSAAARGAPALDPVTVHEVLGSRPDPHELACLHFDVLAAVRRLEEEIATGSVMPGVRLVRGRPLADWLDLADVARLLRTGAPR